MEWTIANYEQASEEKKKICLKYYLWAMKHNLRRYLISHTQFQDGGGR